MRAEVAGRSGWAVDAGLEVLGDGVARTAELTAGRQRAASFYADPVAWLVVDAVEAALESAAAADPAEPVRSGGADVGVLAVSEHGTLHTMSGLAPGAARGRVSPLRFAGANPGSIAGLPCIVFGFRGPSLMLTMPPAAGRDVLGPIARSWLAGGCRWAVVAEHLVEPDGRHVARAAVVRRPRD